MDLPCDMGLAVGMDESADLVMALLGVAGGMLEDAAALAPLSEDDDLVRRIHVIESSIENAGHVVKAAKVIVRTASEPS